jgi:LysM repeat protein
MPFHHPVGRRVPAPVRVVAALTTMLALTAAGNAGYTVRPGQTLSGIAARHGVSVSSLAAANRIQDIHFIRAGAQLRLPSGATGGAGGVAAAVHTVKPGETLSALSARYGVGLRRIARANDLSSYHWIYAGQRLRIPGATAVRSAVTSATPTSREQIGAIIDRTARQYGFHPRFIKAIAYMESGWNNEVVSSAGAIGTMQVLPSTGEFVGRYLVGRSLDLSDPQDNVLAGTAFVSHLWSLTGGDPEKVLAGYYQGLRSVRINGLYDDTKHYIATVMALRHRFD